MNTETYIVAGMSCDHCVNAVTSAVKALPDMADVQVILASNELIVSGDPLPNTAALAQCVADSGYELRMNGDGGDDMRLEDQI
jgi:copper chaperone CopZ